MAVYVEQYRCGAVKLSLAVLIVVLLAFALQPCFAVPTQINAVCCGHGHNKTCHVPAPKRICTMQTTVFAGPEETSSIVLPMALPAPVAGRAVTFDPGADIVSWHDAKPSAELYLRNLVLLI